LPERCGGVNPVELRDAIPVGPAQDDEVDSVRSQCRSFGATFVDYQASVAHIDDAHPETVPVDPTDFSEAVAVCE
jgi:hypothetical protein